MPFKSTAQRGFMFAKHPDIAKRFAAETPKGAKLPEHVSRKSGGMGMGMGSRDTRGPIQRLFSGKKGK